MWWIDVSPGLGTSLVLFSPACLFDGARPSPNDIYLRNSRSPPLFPFPAGSGLVLPLSVVKRKVRLDNWTASCNEISGRASCAWRVAGAFDEWEVMWPDAMKGGMRDEGVERGCNDHGVGYFQWYSMYLLFSTRTCSNYTFLCVAYQR